MKVPNNLLPTHHIFRTRKAANIYMKELETVLKYPKGAGYLQVVQINAPKEIN
jgi:hypothetical protein